MRAALAFLALLPALALATISITGPSSDDYWVQNTSKTITWTYASGDPNPITIVIVNPDPNVLNGEFSIDEYVDISLETFTITNVSLKNGTGFQVEFVNPANHSDVYATGPSFEVRLAGTPPSNISTSAPSPSSSGSSSGSSSSTTSPAPSGTSDDSDGAMARGQNVFYMLAACGFAGLATFVL